jgi:hypothetical protein
MYDSNMHGERIKMVDAKKVRLPNNFCFVFGVLIRNRSSVKWNRQPVEICRINENTEAFEVIKSSLLFFFVRIVVVCIQFIAVSTTL